MRKKPLNSILIKPAGPDCNLHCGYCFYLNKATFFGKTKSHRMSLGILKEVIRQVMTQGAHKISIGWQGGEPTLMGLPFFEKAVQYMQHYGQGKTVSNGLQTNGLLIDRDWVRFFKTYNFLVGLSLDGPQEIHNRYRTNIRGQGSWSQAVCSAELLLTSGVNANVLSVVNAFSVQFPEDIYHFHKSLGFEHMQFIPCIEPDPHDPLKLAPFSVPPEEYGRFLCLLFDLWWADFQGGRPTTSIRRFDGLLQHYLGQDASECILQRKCGDYLVIEHNGDIYGCDFFVTLEDRAGNVGKQKLTQVLNSARQRKFGLKKAALAPKCLRCRWLRACYGGCLKDRLHNPESKKISAFCRAYQIFFEYADRRLQRLARQLRPEIATPVKASLHSTGKPRPDKIGRSQPCPCGSGKKYKRCCGKSHS